PRAVDLTVFVHRDNMRMMDRRRCASFAGEALEALGVASQARRKHLDGDGPTKARVARFVNFPHAARHDWGQDLVRAETGTSQQGHLGLLALRGADCPAVPFRTVPFRTVPSEPTFP